MSVPTECWHYIDGRSCNRNADVWYYTAVGILLPRCSEHVRVSLRPDSFKVLTSYNDAVVYEAMREL